jgi:hypothetical protein
MEAQTQAMNEGSGSEPPPRRGARLLGSRGDASPLRAAAAVLVAVAIAAMHVRLDWDAGFFLVVSLLASAIVVPWALGATPDRGLPDGPTSALIVAALVVVALTVGDLADALGGEGGPGSTTWSALLFAGLAVIPGWLRDSPVAALASSVALGVAFIAAIDWIFDPSEIGTFRWLFLLVALAYAGAAFVLEGDRRRHAVQHVSAAGLALLVLAGTLYVEVVAQAFTQAFSGGLGGGISYNAPLGWELVVLVGSAAVIGYAILRREPGPGYIGAIVLAASTLIAAAPDGDGTLVGWPLLLLLLALAAVAGVLVTEDRR